MVLAEVVFIVVQLELSKDRSIIKDVSLSELSLQFKIISGVDWAVADKLEGAVGTGSTTMIFVVVALVLLE